MEHMNEAVISVVPVWPESKQIYKPKQKNSVIHSYIYPTLFFFYFIALYILFGLYKLMLSLTLRLYIILKSYERQRLKRRLVIVGGGYAGTYAAKTLEYDFLVTLIDTKDYFEFTPSKLRLLVEPKHAQKVQVKHKDFLQRTLVVTDWVKVITPDAVVTETQSIAYDYLIICSGSRTPDFKFSNSNQRQPDEYKSSMVVSVRTPHFEEYHAVLRNSQSILIIGGGTVGVELAGEIVENYKDKQVTIVHSSSGLMPRSPERAIRYTEEFFIRNGASLIFNDKVMSQEGNLFVTRNGKNIEADVAFLCTGNVPNSEFLKNPYFADTLNSGGFVKVNQYLQIDGYSNIYVAGDLSDIPEEEEKLCQTAAAEVKTVVANIKSLESGKPLVQYIAGKCPMLISLGKYDGICTYRGYAMTGFVPAAMKEFVEWKEMIYYWNWEHFQLGRKTKENWSSHAHIV